MILEGIGIAAAPVSTRGRRRARVAAPLGWIRERLATTPGRLVLLSILVVVGAACFGVLATGAEQSRARAVRAARTDTEPLLVHAVNLYTALSDANATVATGLLAGGLEPPAKRARYVRDLLVATQSLTALARETGTAARVPAALATVANELPVYAGLVETARANNRQRFPVGAAYLRQAAGMLTGSILPAADRLYRTEAERLNQDYEAGTASGSLIALSVAIAAALGLLVLAQVYLARISQRILNVGVVLATVALVAVSAWAVIAVVSQQNALVTAQRQGSDSVELLSAANVLMSRAEGDLSLALVNRGTDVTDPQDFATVIRTLETSGLADRLGPGFAAYRTAAGQIESMENAGLLGPAVRRAPTASAIAEELRGSLGARTAAAQERFISSSSDASSDLSGLWLAIPLITFLAGVLALLGLRQRINEYL